MEWMWTTGMMSWQRKAGMTALFVLSSALAAQAQFRTVQTAEPGDDGQVQAVGIVPPGRETLQALTQAQEALKQGRTADGLALAQRLIDLPEDFFLDRSMQETLKSQALSILANLSSTEREAYELLHGATAKNLLAQARLVGDSERIAEVMRRFPFTQAGREAAELLALEARDHGRAWQAASRFSQLRSLPGLSREHARQLAIEELFAWHQAGQPDRAANLLRELLSGGEAIPGEIGGKSIPQFADAKQAERWLAQVAGPAGQFGQRETSDWLSDRGSASGGLAATETGPIGGPLWRNDYLAELEAGLPRKRLGSPGRLLSELLDFAESERTEAEQVTWTTAMPLAVGDVTVFRTPRDIVALDRSTGQLRWRSVLTAPEFDELWMELAAISAEAGLTEYLRQRVYEDATHGLLSSDGEYVFSVDSVDRLVTPQPAVMNNARGLFVPSMEFELAGFNRLAAYEVAGGRLAWEIGGDRTETAGEFAGHFFLGPPLFSDGNLFVLAEVQGELRLVVLESKPNGVQKIWSQPLVVPVLSISNSEERRRAGLIPACSQGVVVCPTGTGAVVAVDFSSRRLLWSYRYDSTLAAPIPGQQPFIGGNIGRGNRQALIEEESDGWRDGNAVIANGRVFITPTDSEEIHCLNFADGKLLWKSPRDHGLLLAGADAQRAVVVGSDRVDGLRAGDGQPLWSVHVTTPAGRGVWMADRYLLPLSSGEIASLDLATGRLLARSKLPNDLRPGNLAAVDGALLSLSAKDMIGFRSVEDVEGLIAERLAKNRQDAEALAARGELRLHRGEFESGLEDLRAAIAQKPEPYAKSVLAAALLEGLRTDFDRYRDSVSELEQLTEDAGQRNEFLWLAARGLKQNGEPAVSMQRLLPLMDQALNEFSSERFGSPWTARTDRRLSGWFAELYHTASDKDRAEMDRMILARLPSKDAADSTESLRRFLRVFGFHPAAAGARLHLAKRLDSEADPVNFYAEWSRLSEDPDPKVAGPATGVLARWFLSRQRFDDAALQMESLARRFADVDCDSGESGRELAERLRQDADFVAFSNLPSPWPEGVIHDEPSSRPMGENSLTRATVIGPLPAYYLGWSFEADQQGKALVARDAEARQRWRLVREQQPGNEEFVFPSSHRVMVHDHLIGWWSSAHFVVAADLEPERASPRVLWEESLLPPGMRIDTNLFFGGNARVRIIPFGGRNVFPSQTAGIGGLVAMTDSAVIYHRGGKLFAADPLTGELVWSRKDFPHGRAQMSADDRRIAIAGAGLSLEDGRQATALLRTVDGEQVASVPAPTGVLQTIGGSRVLRSEDPAHPTTGPVPLELADLATGEKLWKTELTRPALVQVWNQTEIFTLEENRTLSVRNLSDGVVRWKQELSLDVAAEMLLVQPWRDRYLVIVGRTSPGPVPPGGARVVGFTNHDVPISGRVAAVDRKTGELLWAESIEDTAFDTSQPTGWPILLFAGRMYIQPRAGAVPAPQYLTMTYFDKRTGKLLYSREEPSNISTYSVDVDPDRNRLWVNFNAWSRDLRYTGRKE